MKKVLFAKNKSKWSLGGKIIMWWQGTDFSHVAVLNDDGYVYESVQPESRKIILSEWLTHYEIVYESILPEIGLIDLDFLLGIKYSVLQLLTIGFGAILKPLDFLIDKTNINKKSRLICAELVYYVLTQFFGVKLKKAPDAIDLIDIFKLCKKNFGVIDVSKHK